MQQLAIIITMLISSMIIAQIENPDIKDLLGQDIIINISNIESAEGKIMVGLYASESEWLQKPNKGLIGKIVEGKTTVMFNNIPQGVYAISVFHDENNNNKLDTNFLGIPKEDTGSSNNAPARFGPPEWDDAKFEVKNETITQNIKL